MNYFKGAPAGVYQVIIEFTGSIDIGTTVYELTRQYPISIEVVKGPDIEDPEMGSFFLNGFDDVTRIWDTLTNNIDYDVYNLQATLAADGENITTGAIVEVFDPASNLAGEFDDDEGDGEPAPGRTFMDMSGGLDPDVDVIFTPNISPNAQPGIYRVVMTLTGIINATQQPFTREYFWVFFVKDTRLNITDGEIVAEDGDGLFAGQQRREIEVEVRVLDVENDPNFPSLHDPWMNENIENVEVRISGLPDGVTIVGTDRQMATGINVNNDEVFYYFINIEKWVAPDTYLVTVTVTYTGEDTEDPYTETFTVNLVIEYTPFIEVVDVQEVNAPLLQHRVCGLRYG